MRHASRDLKHFRCMVCDEMRPDAQISTYSERRVRNRTEGADLVARVNHCNDRRECALGARLHPNLDLIFKEYHS